MDDIELLREYGLVGRIDSLASMRGEEIAIRFSANLAAASSEDADSNDGSLRIEEEEGTSDDERSIDDGSSYEIAEAEGITYMELQYSYQSASSQLQYRCGVTAGDKVLVCCKGHPAAEIVALLACMKLGAAFVPIDESWINIGGRVKEIIQDAKPVAAIVVADDDNDYAVLAFAAVGLYRCVYLNNNGDAVQAFNTLTDGDGLVAETYGSGASNDEHDVSAFDHKQYPLYVLYTSGSTGRPKGVVGTHHGLINRISWQIENFPFEFGEVVCRRTPLVFVDSMAEIFSALVCMVPLWCPSKERLIAGGIGGIASEAEAAGVSRITLLPSQLHQACSLYADIGSLWPSLKIVFVSGEECSVGVVQAVRQRLPNVTLVNLYGSTEVAGDVTYATLCSPQEEVGDTIAKVPIGLPIKGNYLYVIGADATAGEEASANTVTTDIPCPFKILPEGEIGELLVTGEHLAMGYHNAAQSGSAKFIPNPLRALLPAGDPAAVYDSAFLTGDLVYCQGGVYYWCGRKDRQVKIRGVRMELEDVERAAAMALNVDQQRVVVLASEHASTLPKDASNAKFLVVFVESTSVSSSDVKEALGAALIPAMYPAHVLVVDRFPRNTSGKIDRQALQRRLDGMFSAEPPPNTAAVSTACASVDLAELSVAEVSAEIARLYNRVLGLPPAKGVDIEKLDFFGVGGDSVRMIEVLWELRQWTVQPIVPADLLQSIPALAEQLKCTRQGSPDAPASKKTRTESPLQSTDSRYTVHTANDSLYPVPTPGAAAAANTAASALYSVGRCGATWMHQTESPNALLSAPDSVGVTSQLAVKWTAKMSKCVDASPLVTVYKPSTEPDALPSPQYQVIIGSHGGDVISVDGATGETRWTLQLGEHIEAAAVPSAQGDVVFLGSYSGQDVDGFRSRRPVQVNSEEDLSLGCLWALNALTGAVLWHFCTAGEVKAAVLVLDSSVFLGAYDGYLYQLNAADGALIAKFHCGGSIYATPIVSKDGKFIVVAATSGVISSFSYAGAGVPIKPLQSEQSAAVFSTPLAVSGGFITAGTDGSLTCRAYGGSEDTVAWSAALSSTAIFSSASAVNGACTPSMDAAIIGCHDGKLRKFTMQDGAVLWECSLGVAIFASPFMTSVTECVVATVAGDVVVVDSATGVVRAKLRLPAEVFSSPVCVGSYIYVGCRDDRLYCLDRLHLI